MADLTPEQIAAAKKRGAESSVLPKQVHVDGLPALVDQLQNMIAANKKSQMVLLAAIQQLTETIREKEVSTGTDLSGLIKAVEGLKGDVQRRPDEWELTFERDNRYMIKSGLRFTAIYRDSEE